MSAEVRDAYDAVAGLYSELAIGDLGRVPGDRRWLDRFAELAEVPADCGGDIGPVADLGCGPGHVVDHRCRGGVHTVGYDLSPGLVAEARAPLPQERPLAHATALARSGHGQAAGDRQRLAGHETRGLGGEVHDA